MNEHRKVRKRVASQFFICKQIPGQWAINNIENNLINLAKLNMAWPK